MFAIDFCASVKYEAFFAGAWRSLVAHLVRDEGVAGSNPAAPTIILQGTTQSMRKGSMDLS